MANKLLLEKETQFIDERLHFIKVADGEERRIIGHNVTFFEPTDGTGSDNSGYGGSGSGSSGDGSTSDTGGTGSSTTDSVNTADNTNILMFVLIAATALAAAGGTMIYRKKRG